MSRPTKQNLDFLSRKVYTVAWRVHGLNLESLSQAVELSPQEIREIRGALTLKEWAAMLGVGMSTVKSWEASPTSSYHRRPLPPVRRLILAYGRESKSPSAN